ncbi:MAG: DUF4998 domain-containing protein [Flavobacteriaceae bacterium]|nr:DUF4998 domain-containing protein [Flavobacteriaceae bacterium]
MKKILIFITSVAASIGCDNVNELHEQYLQEGSPVYSGKIDSLDVYSGFYRLKASVYPSPDVNRKEFRVYWNNYADSIVFPYDETYLNSDNGRYEVIIDGFEDKKIEGFTTLVFRNYDVHGNKSRESESNALIYGNDFRSRLFNQGASGFDGKHFNLLSRDNMAGLWVEYTKDDGTQSTLEFKGGVEKLKLLGIDPHLPDYKSGTSFKYRTLYHLNPTDIDPIYAGNPSETAPIVFPDPLIIENNTVHKYGFAETFNIPVQVYEGSAFTSESDQSWCTVVNNNESGVIEVSIAENTASAATIISRTATITVSVVGKTGDDFTKEIQIIQSDATKLDDTKSGWSTVSLSDDSFGETAWGWGTAKLWDGNLGEPGYHTNPAQTTPFFFSVNLGKPLLIDGLEIVPRQRWVKNPEIFEVWASNTETEVGVNKESPDWEVKAIEAGWVKLKHVDFSGWTGTDTRTAYIGATEKYQVIRIRVLKNSSPEGNLNLLELSIIGKE